MRPKMSSVEVAPLVKGLNKYLSTLDTFILPSKASDTVYSTFSGDARTVLEVRINGEAVPTVKNTKILGVTYDNLLSAHCKYED